MNPYKIRCIHMKKGNGLARLRCASCYSIWLKPVGEHATEGVMKIFDPSKRTSLERYYCLKAMNEKQDLLTK